MKEAKLSPIYDKLESGYFTLHLVRLCGLVVGVPGYRSRGPEFDSRRYQLFWEAVGSTQAREYNWGATWKK
jgi:hypothetical protein